MNKTMQRALAALALTMGAAAASAQDNTNELGSGAEAASFYTTDYAKAVDAAYPHFDAARLSARLEGIRKLPKAQLDPLTVRGLPELERLLGVEPAEPAKGADSVSSERYAARIDAKTARIRLVRKDAELQPVAFADATRIKERVAKEHQELLAKLGITPEQLLFTQTGIVSLRNGHTQDAPADVAAADKDGDAPQADGVFTYALRAVDGVMVEGSAAKLGAAPGGQLLSVDLRWPALVFHPALRSMALKDAGTMKKAILAHMKRTANGEEVSVRMAVVLRPVTLSGRRVYVPAMKVGMLPKASAGEVFFVDLTRQALKYDSDDLRDGVSTRQRIVSR